MSKHGISRAEALKGLIVLPALAATLAGFTAPAEAAKSSKAALKYQSSPKGGAKCSGCKFYIKGKNAKAAGQCSIVAGPISPNGWCIAYAKK